MFGSLLRLPFSTWWTLSVASCWPRWWWPVASSFLLLAPISPQPWKRYAPSFWEACCWAADSNSKGTLFLWAPFLFRIKRMKNVKHLLPIQLGAPRGFSEVCRGGFDGTSRSAGFVLSPSDWKPAGDGAAVWESQSCL